MSDNQRTATEPECEILMSPLLSQKFENIDHKMATLVDTVQQMALQVTSLQQHVSEMNTFLENNRTMYVNLLKSIESKSRENKHILEKNSQLYSEAVLELQNEKANSRIVTIFDKICSNNTMLKNNMVSPVCESRIYNRFWRLNHVEKHNKLSKLIQESADKQSTEGEHTGVM